MPVRDPRRVPRRQRPRAGRLRRVWRESELFAELRGPQQRRAPARAAGCSTRAAAGAWRRSSSPGCRSTGPTPSACSGTASGCWRLRGRATAPRPSVDHSARRSAAPRRACATSATERLRRARDSWQPPGNASGVVRDGGGGPAAGQAAPAQVGLHGAGRRLRGGRDAARTTWPRSRELGFAPARRAGLRPAGAGDHGDGSGDLAAGADLADRGAGGAPRRRGGGGARRGRARHRDGAELVRVSKPVEEVVAANPQTFFQIYWAGRASRSLPGIERAQGRRRGGPDRHARLDVLARRATGAARRSPSGSTCRRCCGWRPRR